MVPTWRGKELGDYPPIYNAFMVSYGDFLPDNNVHASWRVVISTKYGLAW